jgi:AbrB family looped-hinge helix DNA binding protein
MSPNGRVTLPAEARRALGLKGESLFEVHQTDTSIVLRPVAVVPLEQARRTARKKAS